ncbi:hypothetical protein CPC08DRAFT_651227 [Agrocybe pediades]|nr:hypothetical protein CPC08DRAFT_651227 [Agrocybe pediades]
MACATSAARSDDLSSLNKLALAYTASAEAGECLVPPIKVGSTKSKTRGHKHPQLSRLLCPAKYLADFDKDPEAFQKKLARGKVAVRSRDFPAFLYPKNGYDPNDLESGLLRNPVLIMVSSKQVSSTY